ncbi:MAG: hypothetical protein OXB91_11925, partial [Bryobacterales bacterium]|nr:hypothetical protein [Bryobacterales bacterium]
MKLRKAIELYVAWRQSHGARFETSACVLRQFGRTFPEQTDCDGVTRGETCRFLAGRGPLTRARANRYGALAGF